MEKMSNTNFSLTAVYQEATEGGYIGYIAEIDGINTQGETLEETKENLLDAYKLMMECRKEEMKDKRRCKTYCIYQS